MRDTGATAWAARTRAIGWRRPVRPRSRALAIGAAVEETRGARGARSIFFFRFFFFVFFFSMTDERRCESVANAAVRA